MPTDGASGDLRSGVGNSPRGRGTPPSRLSSRQTRGILQEQEEDEEAVGPDDPAHHHLAIVPFSNQHRGNEPEKEEEEGRGGTRGALCRTRMSRGRGGRGKRGRSGGGGGGGGRAERTSCALLELPRSVYGGFREVFVSFWSKVAFVCQKRGLLTQGMEDHDHDEEGGEEERSSRAARGWSSRSLFGLLDLLSGFAGSGARRIRFGGSLAGGERERKKERRRERRSRAGREGTEPRDTLSQSPSLSFLLLLLFFLSL